MVDPTVLLVSVGVVIFGLSAGVVRVSFAFLNKQSLLADAISHAAFPGVGLALLLTRSADPIYLLTGAIGAGIIAAVAVLFLTTTTRLKTDAVLGIVLSGFFGAGLVVATIVQKNGVVHQGIINKFLFGCAATLLPRDIYVLVGTCVIVLTGVILF